ncbi:MAG: OmpA family protein [Bryobacterales bacterium]|nr:OmpA family protein [Bryobacterales bacterium]
MADLFDRKGTETGPGTIKQDKASGSEAIAVITLANYNIDGNLMKQEHKDFLDQKLIPLLRANKVHVKLRGMASKSGDRQYNYDLSLGRVLRVKKYLIASGVPEAKVPGSDIEAVGEDYSTSKSDEDASDRAVRIIIAGGTKPRPIYPAIILREIIRRPIKRPKLPKFSKLSSPMSRLWRIKYLGEVGLGAGTAAHFVLENRTNRTQAVCRFYGSGPGLAAPVQVGLEGDWSEFETPDPMHIQDFEGLVSYKTEASVGPVGDTRIFWWEHMLSVQLNTGFSLGATVVEIKEGVFECDAPRPAFEP